MKRFLKGFMLMLLTLSLISVFCACDGENEEKGEETAALSYETLDQDGWSPIWTP